MSWKEIRRPTLNKKIYNSSHYLPTIPIVVKYLQVQTAEHTIEHFLLYLKIKHLAQNDFFEDAVGGKRTKVEIIPAGQEKHL